MRTFLDHCPVASIPEDSLSLIEEQEHLRSGSDLDFLIAMLASLLVALTLLSLEMHLEVQEPLNFRIDISRLGFDTKTLLDPKLLDPDNRITTQCESEINGKLPNSPSFASLEIMNSKDPSACMIHGAQLKQNAVKISLSALTF